MSEQPMAYEEVPGSRTTQDTVVQPQRERIAYEELQPGDVIQDNDEWQNADGRWQRYMLLPGSRVQVRQSQRARRPYNITQMQDERDELKAALRESRAAHEFTMKQGLATIAERNEAERLLGEARMERDKAWSDQKAIQACRDTALQKLGNADKALSEERAAHVQIRNERDEACRERDLARAEVARLSTELWARKPLEDRVTSLTDELAQTREGNQQLQSERDETRAELQRLQEVVGDLYSEPTARQVQDMLRTWATELDWSAGCFDSVGRDEIDTIQKTLIAVIERIEAILNPEGGSDGE